MATSSEKTKENFEKRTATSTRNDVAKFVTDALEGTVEINSATDVLHTRKVDTHFTPLQCAVQQLNFNLKLKTAFNARTVLNLIKKGADVNLANPVSKVTPLHLAVKYADFLTVKLLLNNGADINARDNMNRNCLVNATERGNPAVCKLLVEEGLDPSERQEVFYMDGGKRNGMHVNVAEKMMLGDENQLTSWRILGAPSLVDYLSVFSFYLDQKVEIASQHLTKVAAFVQGKGQKNFAFNGDVSYKTALSKRVVGLLFPLRENSNQVIAVTKGCRSMVKVSPQAVDKNSPIIDLSNGAKNGAMHGPKNGPVTMSACLNGTCVLQMYLTNSSSVTHLPNKLVTYLGLSAATVPVSGSFLVNGSKVQKEVRLLKEDIEVNIVGTEIKFQLRADRCIVSDLERFQVCVSDLPHGTLKVKLGDGTNKGPKNSPLALIVTGAEYLPGDSALDLYEDDKKNVMPEIFKTANEEIELTTGLNDGKEFRIDVEGDGDSCGFCQVSFTGLMKCPKCPVKYCSKACQKLDWKAHKKVCCPVAK
ncbi:hypothetical protein TrST_g1801 [Triparma strigata]|uniref:Uncharacterized protein n=1 Tax=Triparma strigata TaxID=1606541 RepID=A0A9W7BK67_9STRA|nr:hypothetical protein TrST_g1801 [Triparma strigata]